MLDRSWTFGRESICRKRGRRKAVEESFLPRLELPCFSLLVNFAAHLLIGRLHFFRRDAVFLIGRWRPDKEIPDRILDSGAEIFVTPTLHLGLTVSLTGSELRGCFENHISGSSRRQEAQISASFGIDQSLLTSG